MRVCYKVTTTKYYELDDDTVEWFEREFNGDIEEYIKFHHKEMYKYDEDEPIITGVEIDGTKEEQEKMNDLICEYYNHDEEDYQRMIGESLTGRIFF